jgi:peptidoglycan hydrolase CwlO-like protein
MNRILACSVALTVMVGCNGGNQGPTPLLPDPGLTVLEEQHQKLISEIREIEKTIESRLDQMIKQIEDNKLDVSKAADDVRETIAEVDQLRKKAREIRDRFRNRPGSTPSRAKDVA